jgi:deoxyribodipyrimidine photo-lyase
MLESLHSLNDSLGGTLQYFEANTTEDVLENININKNNNNNNIKSIWFNRDVTPFAITRDKAIEVWCKNKGILYETREDYTLHSVNNIRTKTGNIYKVFTPFYNNAVTLPVANPQIITTDIKISLSLSLSLSLSKTKEVNSKTKKFIEKYAPPHDSHVDIYGGRSHGLDILHRIKTGEFKTYSSERNNPSSPEGATRLAAYLKFGCISIREAFYAVEKAKEKGSVLLSQLFWREFYFHLTFHMPQLLSAQIGSKNETMKERMANIKWKSLTNPEVNAHWNDWCNGTTGYPIVDAGMRQLNETGYMHNRTRMIVAMFLTKHLHIDWRQGERYFAKMLIDYDPCQNNGGWQWSASTGVDTQPYRIFNPWLQTERYDPNCTYIKKWIPELANLPIKTILKWNNEAIRTNTQVNTIYNKPIVDHAEAVKEGKKLLKGL